MSFVVSSHPSLSLLHSLQMSTEQSSQPDLRLGTVLYGKQKAWTFRLQQYGSRRNVTVQAIDLDQPIEQQGDFDLVLHKVVALVADEHVDPEAAARLSVWSSTLPSTLAPAWTPCRASVTCAAGMRRPSSWTGSQ